MSLVDDVPAEDADDPLDRLRHDLKSPLVTIHGRAQLLARSVQRSSALSEEEQRQMLVGLAAIEAAVQQMVTVIDGMGRSDGNDGGEAG